MTSHAVVTLTFTRPVKTYELRTGDTFAFPDAPLTPLTVLGVEENVLSPDLTMVALTLSGLAEPMNLPAGTPVRALRMRRTVVLSARAEVSRLIGCAGRAWKRSLCASP
ncbi:hypothetical protein [Streptomyces sp. NPDC097610]|uniref:hypothetical protein n=1 Tax=Streptomyces sp. NPDC097610 TaxID=3157227 RepID=UPI0033243A81